MKKITLFYLAFLALFAMHAQDISRLEYFVDSDPGFGNATNITMIAGDDVVASFTIDTTGLAPGIHWLSVRAFGETSEDNTAWSLISSSMFITIDLDPSATITKLEYFIDSDPGPDNAISISITPGSRVSATFDIDTTGLVPGIHMLVVRAKQQNSSGTEIDWSIVASSLFYTVDLAPLPNITRLEYFIDTDPGYGAGIPVLISSGINPTATFTVITAGLCPGIHMLVARVENTDGDWSMAAKQLFYVYEPEITDIIRMEYYIDDDPGYGNGTEIPIISGHDVEITFPIDSIGWTVGDHTFYLRIKNSSEDWSLVNSFSFPVPFERSWVGKESDDWDSVRNWNPPGIPPSSEKILIKGDAVRMPVIKFQGISCDAIRFETGAGMTILEPNTFTVSGDQD